MSRKPILAIACLIALIIVAGCCSSTVPAATPVAATPHPVSADGRLLGIDLTQPADGNFSETYYMAKVAGIGLVQLTPGWDDIEPTKGPYIDPQSNLASAKAFYSIEGLRVALAVSPLDTNINRMPSDLKNKPFNDPEVIDRYNAMMNATLSKLDGLTLLDVSIGNEVDISLGNDDTKWAQYTDFYRQTKDYLKASHPNLMVGVKATFYGLTRDNVQHLQTLNKNSDVILVTYYPLNPDFTVRDPSVVKEDFDKICALYPGKSIYFLEAGYPSSTLLNSSDEKQAEFVRDLFAAWDEHSDQIKVINFVYMHDVSQADIDRMVSYYGLSDPRFAAYLGTLGLRTNDDKDKPAWTVFQNEAKARDF